jgi:undecaprenyl diphosphate synthase
MASILSLPTVSDDEPSWKGVELSRKILAVSSQVLGVVVPPRPTTTTPSDEQQQPDYYSWMIPLADNASFQCPTNYYSDNAVSEEQSIVRLAWRLLYWLKRIVLRLTRTYHADLAVLFVLPLVMGLWLGVHWGRRLERQEKNHSNRAWGDWLFAWLPTSLLVWTLNHHQRRTRRESSMPLPSNATERRILKFKNSEQDSSFLRLLLAADDPHPCLEGNGASFPRNEDELDAHEELARNDLQSDHETVRESGIPVNALPQHIAFIMDGNRRYGRRRHGNTVAGHWDGSKKVLDVAKWCIAEKIPYVTVYAFSTENWKRDPAEVAALMEIFAKYAEELRHEALARNIRVRVLSTDPDPIPPHVATGLKKLQDDTEMCTGLCLNVCLSDGSRSEMVQVTRSLVSDCIRAGRQPSSITESDIAQRLLTRDCPDPDILIRTSGEVRISNYLLWQLAYAELFFLEKNWPELEKEDLLQVLRSFSCGRSRRFGK